MAPELFTKLQQCTDLMSRLHAAGKQPCLLQQCIRIGCLCHTCAPSLRLESYRAYDPRGAAPQSSTSGCLWQEGDVGDEAGCTDEEFEQYCKAVEETAAWGGQIELGALAALLQRRIIVYSVGMPAVNMGPDNPGACWTKLAPALPHCVLVNASLSRSF